MTTSDEETNIFLNNRHIIPCFTCDVFKNMNAFQIPSPSQKYHCRWSTFHCRLRRSPSQTHLRQRNPNSKKGHALRCHAKGRWGQGAEQVLN